MAAACTGHSDAVPKKTACEFMHADRGNVRNLPERAPVSKGCTRYREAFAGAAKRNSGGKY